MVDTIYIIICKIYKITYIWLNFFYYKVSLKNKTFLNIIYYWLNNWLLHIITHLITIIYLKKLIKITRK